LYQGAFVKASVVNLAASFLDLSRLRWKTNVRQGVAFMKGTLLEPRIQLTRNFHGNQVFTSIEGTKTNGLDRFWQCHGFQGSALFKGVFSKFDSSMSYFNVFERFAFKECMDPNDCHGRGDLDGG